MPAFAASETSDHSLPFDRVFEIDVDPPDADAFYCEINRAFIVPGENQTCISRGLADLYGKGIGEEITVFIRTEMKDQQLVHKYPVQVKVKLADPEQGDEYMQLGVADLHKLFRIIDMDERNEEDDPLFLWLEERKLPNDESQCLHIPKRVARPVN